MGNSYQETVTTVVANAALPTATEVVVAALTLPTNMVKDNGVKLEGIVALTTGTGTTAVQYRIRRGTTITDPLVGTLKTVQVGASLPTEGICNEFDALTGEQANIPYVLTALQVGGTGAGTIQGVRLAARVNP